MYNLKILNLRRNNLEIVRYEIFRHLEEIEEIDLSYNNIAHILQLGLLGHESLRSLSLKGNPLMCDRCYNAWLRAMSGTVLKDVNTTLCHSPEHLRGTPVLCYSLSIEYNYCYFVALPSLDTFDFCDNYTASLATTRLPSYTSSVSDSTSSLSVTSTGTSIGSITDVTVSISEDGIMGQNTTESPQLYNTNDTYTNSSNT